jgi:DNA-binding transcriptional ArsR family regulator
MVNSRHQQLDETFFALSDPTRRAMLERLLQGDCTVTELARPFSMSAPAISKHPRVLERAGLLTQRREGRVRKCHLIALPLEEAREWLALYRRFWQRVAEGLDGQTERTAGESWAVERPLASKAPITEI